jgi:two-component system chemotaxis response regulator CheB
MLPYCASCSPVEARNQSRRVPWKTLISRPLPIDYSSRSIIPSAPPCPEYATIQLGLKMQERAATSLVQADVLPSVRRMIAMGASAGGLHSLFAVLEHLPSSLDCCIAVATHLSPTHNSLIPELLARHTRMPVCRASNERLRNGTIFVAPPRFHLIVQGDRLCLLDEPPLRFVRPNIDLFFQSVAASFGSNAVGVILSGTGHDGSEGVRSIKASGGTIIVEDPIDAEFNDMPIAANRTGCVDFVLSLYEIGKQLMEICSKPPPWRTPSA